MKVRSVLTICLFVALWVMNKLLNVAAPVISADLAGEQFKNSDAAYAVSRGAGLFTGSGVPIIIVLVLLALIWWKPIKGAILGAAMIAITLCAVAPATAYYDKNDYPEIYFILPNESAFFIPDVGANKDSQSQFGSEEYLTANKIAAKRFQIPHVQLAGSSYGRDYYVPAGRLIIVDRTPFNREWIAAKERGTSSSDEGIHCQSQEGLNITVGVAIGTSVFEENSPRFLHRFGVIPPNGPRENPEVVFASVFKSRSLEEVMDGVVRSKVQALVCGQTSVRSFDQASAESEAIMSHVEKELKAYLSTVGITLDYVGWADTFGFDPEVQKAINDAYVAEKIASALPTLERQADIKVKEGLGQGLAKRLPRTLLAPPDMLSGIMGMFAGSEGPTKPKEKPAQQ